MAETKIHAVCQSCGTAFEATPKRSFFGFQLATCPSCQKQNRLPLTKGYRITYYVVLAWMVLTIAIEASSGNVAFPGGIGILVIIALVLDFKAKRQLKKVA